MLNNQIKISFNPKTKKLLIRAPFHLVDVCRSFPNRKFDPKTKLWTAPLIVGNIRHLESLSPRYSIEIDEEAQAAIAAVEELTKAPAFIPFPRHVYDFTRSEKKYLPMEHQDRMLDRAWGLRQCAWFAKMGTGKTFATIHLACARFEMHQIDILVIICPSTLRKTWEKEFKKYATIPYEIRHHETKAGWLDVFCKKRDASTLRVITVSVEGLGVSEAMYDSACGIFATAGRVMAVVDESSRIKNHKALRTNRAISLGASADWRLVLNGTPIALGIQDLWAQYEFLDPNIIGCGDYWSYRSMYLEYGGFQGKQLIGYRNVDQLMKLITPYTVEVDKSVLKLPPKIPKERVIVATREQKLLFRQIIKGEGPYPRIKAQNTLERMLRLRQVVGGWRPYVVVENEGTLDEKEVTRLEPLKENPKMRDLEDFVDDNFAGSKFIIWSTFTHEIEAIEAMFVQKYGREAVATYYGKTDKDSRSQIEDAYCQSEMLRIFIGNPTAAGLGLTLVSKYDDMMYYYSGTSAFIDRTQSEDRAHRIGQDRSVVVADAIMEDTVDELIQQATQYKMDLETFVFQRLREGASEIDLFGGGKL